MTGRYPSQQAPRRGGSASSGAMADHSPAAAPAGALPPLPRSAARLSTCADFPGYLQLLQATRPNSHFPWLRNQLDPLLRNHAEAPEGQPSLASERRSCEVCPHADAAASSVLLPGYSRGSQGALRPARSAGVTAAPAAERGCWALRGSVDGAAGAELLSSWELSQYQGSPARGSRSASAVSGAAAAAAAAAAAVTAALPPPAGGGGDPQPAKSQPSVMQQQQPTELKFAGDLGRAREQALTAAASSLDRVRYDAQIGQQAASNSTPKALPVRAGRGGARRVRAAAVAVWCSLSAFKDRTLRATRALRRVPAGGETPSRSRTTSSGPQEHGTAVRRPYDEHGASDPGACSPNDPGGGATRLPGGGAATAPGDGGASRSTPRVLGSAVQRSPSAPMITGPSGFQDGAGGLDVLAVAGAATSLSSSALGPVLPAIQAADSVVASVAAASASAVEPAGSAADGAAAAGTQPWSRLLRSCAVAAMPWLRCGHRQLSHASRASAEYGRGYVSYGALNACTASPFTALDCLPNPPASADGCPAAKAGGGGGRRGGGSERLPASAEAYLVRPAPNHPRCHQQPQAQAGSAPRRTLSLLAEAPLQATAAEPWLSNRTLKLPAAAAVVAAGRAPGDAHPVAAAGHRLAFS
ncbi:hypothetical protein PLESTF_001468900 [Pleodorina starrii]|nr:hypothetical protein PLESTF_001468900 [Pleodorina starrii]